MKFLILITALTLVSAEDLELMAKQMITTFSPDLNEKGNEVNIKEKLSSLTTGDFAMGAVDEFSKTERNRIDLSIGSIGATLVSVAQGNHQVDMVSLNGFGAGSITVVEGQQRQRFLGLNANKVSLDSVKEVNQPLYDKYVKNISKSEEVNALVLGLDGQAINGFSLETNGAKVKASSFGGFEYSSATFVSKRQ